MNPYMTRTKNETEDSLLSITENCETLTHQTHKKVEETLQFEMTKPPELFHFDPPIQIEEDCMLSLTSLEVYNSVFNIKETNNKLDFFTDTFDELLFIELKDEFEEILIIRDITPRHLQEDK